MTATTLDEPTRGGLGAVWRHSLVIARRNTLHIRSDPGLLLDATLMPIIFTFIFLYVFGGAIGDSTGDYKSYLMPGIMVQTISVASVTTGVALNLDFNTGVMDRFRSLPIARAAVLSGRILSDVARLALGQLVMLAFALVIGFRVTTSPLAAAGAIALLVLFGLALCWVAAFIGLAVKGAQTVNMVGFLWMIPVQFGSSIFVPPDTMPGWLEAFANVNPATLVADACRGLLAGGPVAEPLSGALIWIAALLVVFVPLSINQYRRRQ